MKKTIITVALLAVLTSLAVSCQKEEADITSATPSTVIAENDTLRTVVYTIDGVSYRLTLLGDQAWHDFLSRMFALAEEGHSVTFFNEEAASRVLRGVEPPAHGGQVAHHPADILLRYSDFQPHPGLQQN